MALTEVAPGLRRWTARHEEWGEDVGCLAVDTDDGLVLIDPLAPPRELGRPDHVLLTVFFHARSAKAPQVWAHERMVKRLANRGVEVNPPFTADEELPGGIRAFETAIGRGRLLAAAATRGRRRRRPARRRGEAARHRRAAAAVPERWLGKASHDDLRASLAPLLELPVARVLVSHGEPVLRGGGRALAAALAG
jgi:hypothetical protein